MFGAVEIAITTLWTRSLSGFLRRERITTSRAKFGIGAVGGRTAWADSHAQYPPYDVKALRGGSLMA